MADRLSQLLRDAARAPAEALDAEHVWRAGRRQRGRRMILAIGGTAVVVAVAAVLSAGALTERRVKFAPADNVPQPTPTVTVSESAAVPACRGPRPLSLSTTSGPPGTRVRFTGTCFVGDASTAKKALGAYGLFLIGNIGADQRTGSAPGEACELMGMGDFDLRVRNGEARGYFVVPERGSCFQEPGSEPFVRGRYAVGLGCHTCMTTATFEVTGPVPALPPLPVAGLAAESKEGVRLVDLDGNTLTVLRGWRINWRVTWSGGEPPALRNPDGLAYRLDAAHRRLTRAPEDQSSHANDADEVALPPLRSGGRRSAGHWRWALPSPDGSRLLAQWSGECEVPTAFLLTPDGRRPELVVGETRADAPESAGLGWSPAGLPVVQLGSGVCGSGVPVPGVYEVGDEPRLILRNADQEVQMWTAK